jgi:hypothetical protein
MKIKTNTHAVQMPAPVKKAPSIADHLDPDASGTESHAIELGKLLASVSFVLNYVSEHNAGSSPALLMSLSDVLREGARQTNGLLDLDEVSKFGVPYATASEFVHQRQDW